MRIPRVSRGAAFALAFMCAIMMTASPVSAGDESTSDAKSTAGVPTSSGSSSLTADAAPASAPSSPVAVIDAGTTVTPACPSCGTNWNASNATVAGSHDPVLWSNGSLVDSATGRAAYFGPNGQAAYGGPQPGTQPFTMPDGRTSYYIPIPGAPLVSPVVSITWDIPAIRVIPRESSTPSAPGSSVSTPDCSAIAGGFARPDGTCNASRSPVRPT